MSDRLKIRQILCFKSFSILVSVFISLNVLAQEGDPAIGKTLFDQNCGACHSSCGDKLVGPGLKGIAERRTIEWLIPWVKNSQKVIQSGDDYANKLFKEYNGAVMTAFPSFSDQEINSIFAYLKQNEPNCDKKVEAVDTGTPVNGGASNEDLDKYLNLILIGFIVILLLVLLVLVFVVSTMTRILSLRDELTESEKELVNQKFEISKILTNKAFLFAVGFIFVSIIGKAGLDEVLRIGIQQGYAPTQPIAFSHKLHAGQYEIDCNYCHTGVRKAKSANIPSANICMNCHKEIKKDSPLLAPLRAAIEEGKPIEWVRIHNLPDLAFFSHEQHVKVGELECQQCHGPIETMERVEQYAPLTMGWCINCHRETQVKHEGNAYYDKLVKIHTEVHKKKDIKVEDIGGLECAKCHY